MSKSLASIIVISMLIFVFRVIPHSANFSPVIGMMLIAGFLGRGRWYSYVLPMGAYALSHSSAVFYPGWAFTFVPLVLAIWLGFFMESRLRSSLFYALAGAVAFFLVSNFGVWASSGMYTYDLSGLIHCYYRGIPFFRVTLSSTLLVTTGFTVLANSLKKLQPSEVEV